MESTAEKLNILQTIHPPTLEEAGLEDCALSPDAIKQAFFKAASAVTSRAASIFPGEEETHSGCISDPWVDKPAPSDALVGVQSESTFPGPCATGKDGGYGDPAIDVVVMGEKTKEAAGKDVMVVGGGGGEGGDCVDGLRGLEIKEEENKNDEEEDDKKPTLIEGYFLNP